MNWQEQQQLLSDIRRAIKECPTMVTSIQQAITDGLVEQLAEERKMRADVEVALAMSLSMKYKSSKQGLVKKLEGMKGKSLICWDDVIEEMKNGLPTKAP